MNISRFSIRVARKTARVGNKIFHKGSRITEKIENKATRILDGVDFSVKINQEVPLEKIYYNSIPHVLPIHASMPAVGSSPTVTLLIPSLDGASFFGGTATALVVAAKFALKLDRKLRIVQTLKTGHPGDLSVFFESEGVEISSENIKIISVADRAYNQYGYISMHPDDLFIASAWWDAHILAHMPLKNKFIYLIQDFEPIFYNNSDMYILADETYKGNDFIPLCNTKLMADFMRDHDYPAFDKEVIFFEPAVSRKNSGLALPKKASEKKQLFLYGRPDVHRNLFFTALNAIDYVFKVGSLKADEWEISMAGQDNLPDIKLPSGLMVRNLGKMEMQDYINFSKSVDLAISLMMAPHPNYPTLEFASIGSSVVTTKYANKQSLANYSNNIFISDISVEELARVIKTASKESYDDRIKNTKQDNIPNTWSDALDTPISKLISLLK